MLRAIMIGDVVGEPGLAALERRLPLLVKEYSANIVIVNGENAAGGFGLSEAVLERLFAAGADVVTGGNHIWELRDFWPVLDSNERVLRPLNYPSGCPGKGFLRIERVSPEANTPIPWIVVNLQGREFMTALDCPFKAFDAFEDTQGYQVTHAHPMFDHQGFFPENMTDKPIILVDFHAESSREKEALAYYLDGRAAVVAGTHTHVQTADERLLPKGTAYITDLGMAGSLEGVIGMEPKICLDRARNQVLYRMEVAAPEGAAALQGIVVEFDAIKRKAVSIKRISTLVN